MTRYDSEVKTINNVKGAGQLRYMVTNVGLLFNLYDIAKGLKFTRNTSKKSSAEPEVNVAKLNEYLQDSNIEVSLDSNNDTYISEADYYRLSYHSRSSEGLEFQFVMSTEIIPSIHTAVQISTPFNQLISSFNELNNKVLAIELQLSKLTTTSNSLIKQVNQIENQIENDKTASMTSVESLSELQSLSQSVQQLRQDLTDCRNSTDSKLIEMSDQVKTTSTIVDSLTNVTKELKLNLIKQENNLLSIKTEFDSKLRQFEGDSSDSNLFTKIKNFI